MNTAYVGEIVAARNGSLPPSFLASSFSAYSRVHFCLKNGQIQRGMELYAEYDRIHRNDKNYWTYRRYLEEDVANLAPSPVSMAEAA